MGAAENRTTIERLYAAMQQRDGAAMADCYAVDGTFTDPVFGELADGEPGDMWRMLTSRSTDLSVELGEHEANDRSGSASWVARYTFTQTGRGVVNEGFSLFDFDPEGLIRNQHDDFDFWRWARQALGRTGWLLGWTPVLQHSVRDRARTNLERFRSASG